jgi:hypothetical protein
MSCFDMAYTRPRQFETLNPSLIFGTITLDISLIRTVLQDIAI